MFCSLYAKDKKKSVFVCFYPYKPGVLFMGHRLTE